ncbi:hypothetical protein JAAARDRAFT_199478 [Jaapia argillacea MUCL 33604]|uniref:Uncharacterized protein n=1 Tax=Jaapia argillacea MUCL 33604 TaxID=933084 RepID=A0A067PKV3_9AGAM|nr:hypothetical protein JAAARDRAFT_199478 [Jaapia argillacea MUCL 33604]
MASKDTAARKRARADRQLTVAPPVIDCEELKAHMAELMEQMKMADKEQGTAGEVKDTEVNEMKGNKNAGDVTILGRTKSKSCAKTPAPTRAKSEAPKGKKGKDKAENASAEKDNIKFSDTKKPEPAIASVGSSASASTSEAAKPIRIGQLSIVPDNIPYIVNLLLGITPKASVRPFGNATQRDLFIQAGLLKQAILQTFYQKHTAAMTYYKLMGNRLCEKESMAQSIHVDQNMMEEEIIRQWVEALVPAPTQEADGE